MQLKYISLFILVMIIFLSCKNSVDPSDRQEKLRFDFVLHNGLSSSVISDISQELENNYVRIINDLQVQNMPAVIVKIWSDYASFLEAMETSLGVRYVGATGYIFNINEIRLFHTPRAPLTAVHEFAHLVSMQVNARIPNNPRWLWEAVALYEAQQFVDPKTLPYMLSGDYPTLSQLNTNFNNSEHQIYSVGYVLLEYVIQNWGMEGVIGLIRNNGNIPALLGRTTAEFESGWYQFVEDKYLR